MWAFFENVLGYLELAFTIAKNLLQAPFYFLSLISAAVNVPILLTGVLPPVLGAAVTAFMIIWIVKGIFGR